MAEPTPPGFASTVRAALALVEPPLRRRGVHLALLAAAVGAAEALVAALVFGLLARVATGAAPAGTVGALLSRLAPGDSIAAAALVVFASTTGKNLLVAWETSAGIAWVNEGAAQLSARLFGAFVEAGHALQVRRHSADLVHAAGGQADFFFRTSVASVRQAASEACVVTGVLGLLVLAAPGPAIGAAAACGLLLAALLRATWRRAHALGGRVAKADRAVATLLSESLQGARELELAGLAPAVRIEFEAERRELARLHRARGTLEAAPRLVAETVFVAGLALVVGVAPEGRGEVVALLGLFAYAGLRLMPSVHRFVYHQSQVRLGAAVGASLRAHLEEAERLAADRAGEAVQPPVRLTGELVLEDVTVRHTGAARAAIEGVSLRIRRGERVAIVGATGAGKTTLLDVMVGLTRPASGHVHVDGTPLEGRARAWQRSVAYLPQTPFLLASTLAHNVTLERDPTRRDAARLQGALAEAQLADFVAGLPDGLETQVGERGTRLSGGERQRLALARALYRQADLLVLDEATSALDGATREALLDALGRDRARTHVFVTHEAALVRRCDRVVLLEAGRIVAEGSPAELDTNPRFLSLFGSRSP